MKSNTLRFWIGTTLAVACCAVLLFGVTSCSKSKEEAEPQPEAVLEETGAEMDISVGKGDGALAPLLVDVSGWTADESQEMKMKVMGTQMWSATRDYEKQGKNVTAILTVGKSQVMNNPSLGAVPDVEASVGGMTLKKIDGFQVQTIDDPDDGSSMVSIFLVGKRTGGGGFTLSSEEMPSKDIMEFAKNFDWNAMKAAIK